ncbi:MAG TPA: hypothetical protein VEJ44_06885 [Acidimicrobiales bacterium]|nr:hypothetical protein [Acidimicrobiales bacterium]
MARLAVDRLRQFEDVGWFPALGLFAEAERHLVSVPPGDDRR